MDDPAITIVIEGRTYRLRADQREAIGAVPTADRQRLIELLEAVKAQQDLAESVIQDVMQDSARPAPAVAARVTTREPLGEAVRKSGRLGSGDIDNLVARLAIEERQSRKALPTRHGVYKWIAGLAVLVVLLVLVL